jgi:prolyl-tRNA synthetase
MKFSNALIKTKRESGKQIESINADLLTRANYIDQVMAGVYTYLPLGLRVLDKIAAIIRDEMNKAGGQELLMPVLHPKENWEKTGRWESLDDLFKFTSYYSKTHLALGPTHEEIVVPLAKRYIYSYKDLPKYLYQIQDKFRDEKRAKSGILRGREFLMKDLYSFHEDEKDLDKYYLEMKKAYENIFKRAGIGEKTYFTFASGGSFSKYSHEFQTETEAGEDTIYLCEKCKVAVNKEIISEQNACPECKNKSLKEIKAVEVGNIFKLKTKYSEPFDLKFADKLGKEQLVMMGCYGVGLGRLMGTIVEVCHDDKGIIWPKEVAPFDIHLVELDGKTSEAKELYDKLQQSGADVLWDDRNESAGIKLADADLIGIPCRIVVSAKSLKESKVEIKYREKKETKMVSIEEVLKGEYVK